ncbi:MAG: hypothetical protein OMM_01671 [Candidatus Magnetoglobus multicellularis str. Araruama]|uniref:Uncharacterized protein n=1 Tax=Candidatus Magnetoglobus multicellularis str. Araruama TaxID=890399 RepID=A0A1V1PCK8_9BACT|nr:MAG: hypothetical protein OMM_01671 [Candidatus Magnetoglobus multicellularis str. Araruama]
MQRRWNMKCFVQIPYIVFCAIVFCQFISFAAISETEHLLYAVQINGKSYEEKMIVHHTKDLMQYEACGNYTDPRIYSPGGRHCWDVVSTSDGQPLLTEYQVGPNRMQMTFNNNGLFEMKGIWDGKNCYQKKVFNNNVYIELTGMVRNIDLTRTTPIQFDLVRITKFPLIETHCLYFKVLDDVVIDVPAGHFKCKKLLLTASGMKGFFLRHISI